MGATTLPRFGGHGRAISEKKILSEVASRVRGLGKEDDPGGGGGRMPPGYRL